MGGGGVLSVTLVSIFPHLFSTLSVAITLTITEAPQHVLLASYKEHMAIWGQPAFLSISESFAFILLHFPLALMELGACLVCWGGHSGPK